MRYSSQTFIVKRKVFEDLLFRATNQDASDIFGDDYGVDYPKEHCYQQWRRTGRNQVSSQEALQIDSGGAGTIITNNGTLTGAGGAAGLCWW